MLGNHNISAKVAKPLGAGNTQRPLTIRLRVREPRRLSAFYPVIDEASTFEADMISKVLPPIETVREFVDFDADTGIFYWKHRDKKWFKTLRAYSAWNAKNAGNAAGTLKSDGYVRIRFFREQYAAHRLAWLLVTGKDPARDEIDHFDRNRSNNKISNLRLATDSQNAQNRLRGYISKTGVSGVYQSPNGKFYVQIKCQGKTFHLGIFETIEEATNARERGLAKYHKEYAQNAQTN